MKESKAFTVFARFTSLGFTRLVDTLFTGVASSLMGFRDTPPKSHLHLQWTLLAITVVKTSDQNVQVCIRRETMSISDPAVVCS